MRWTIGERIFESKAWASKGELKDFLSQCDRGSLLLGEGAESQRQFYSVTVTRDWGESEWFGIGICSEGHGLIPYILTPPHHPIAMFGFNSEVVAININEQKTAFSLSLDSLFRRFVVIERAGIILVFHEIGLVAINEKGSELWRYANDVIKDCQIEGNEIALQFMDKSPVLLDMLTGKLKQGRVPLGTLPFKKNEQ